VAQAVRRGGQAHNPQIRIDGAQFGQQCPVSAFILVAHQMSLIDDYKVNMADLLGLGSHRLDACKGDRLAQFFLAQPGNILFMASTRKLDLDGLLNSFVAMGVIAYSANQLGLQPSALDLLLYAAMIFCGLIIHYSMLVITISLAFWLTSAQGIESSYFTLSEFSRLPRAAFKGVASVVFVWLLPVVVVSNAPAEVLLRGFQPNWVLALLAATIAWFVAALIIFHRGLRRYASASS
jgi:ABC-2 type transport system permease protein